MKIESKNYIMRPIVIDDVNEVYLSWLQNERTSQYINSAKSTDDLKALMRTVEGWLADSSILFFAIIDKATQRHIGNIKFDPVNSDEGYTFLGILIGDPAYRGKGVAAEVIHSCGRWLNDNKNISEIILGVNKNNYAAIRAYEKTGFVAMHIAIYPKSKDIITMKYELNPR